MPAIKAIIHDATPARCAAADGTPVAAVIVVGVIVGAGVAKQRKKRHSGHDQSRLVSRNRGFYCDRELPEPRVTRLQKASYSAYVTQDTKGFHGGASDFYLFSSPLKFSVSPMSRLLAGTAG